jgi:hypothetical protein
VLTTALNALAAASKASDAAFGMALKAKDETLAFAVAAMNEAKVAHREEHAKRRAAEAALAEARTASEAALWAKDVELAAERKINMHARLLAASQAPERYDADDERDN